MWACLEGQETENQWRQVAGWRKICDLAGTHLSRLKEYRRGLADAWPPDTNEAARAYIRELDELIEQVQQTHDAAASNYTALSAAVQAISASRAKLREIFDQYAAKRQQKLAWEETAADPKAVAGSRTSQPPVTDADLERLNVQARGIMYGLSGELQQAQVMLRQPPTSPRQFDRAPEFSEPYGAASIPVIPPIVPVPLPTVASPSATGPKSSRHVPASLTPAVGPVLGGANPGLAPAPTHPGLPSPPPPGPTTPPAIGVPPSPPIGTGGRPSSSGPGPLGRPTVGDANNPSHRGTNVSRAMPPGGLIGGLPGTGLGQPASGGPQPRRVNPIGGVIGGGGAGTAPTGGAGSRPGGGRSFPGAQAIPPIGGFPGSTGVGLNSGRPLRPERRDDEPRTWDPDHPWETNQGVDPVVRPPKDDGPIDPGPAIGFNR
ncbi:hypothetical protein GA0070616_3510 [Micromonospora nigra]|uniref:PPE family protein n=1 Tax=Micromonospora nigra TaxID=145857 RepID=A0A1C6SDL8_9ACTN|nr:hypothetical protein [Micromonospora nigra]SCL27493.1 hypothetical protein GA0070616_3510 [Micromonospora nigra]